MDNSWGKKKELLISMIQYYFLNLFKKETDNITIINIEAKLHLLNSDQNRHLSRKLIDFEIKKTIFSFESTKAPEDLQNMPLKF